ncbi:MAG: GH25 family lysozyme [Lachnospiraceae bacterium]|nr:GH25 family lysozyme [Lachnospiraceae bacterium]
MNIFGDGQCVSLADCVNFMERNRFTGKKARNAVSLLLSAAMLFAAVPVQAAGAVTEARVETEVEAVSRKYTSAQLRAIDGEDGEYWKYYDAEGNRIEEIEGEKPGTYSADPTDPTDPAEPTEPDVPGNSLQSPYTDAVYTVLPGYEVSHGVDVSKYQPEIDWDKMKADGIESVIIRCAYRGYGSGGSLSEDPIFDTHIAGALAAGLKVGIYIYSQAITSEEAVEEANYCLSVCEQYLDQLDLPIVMDVEYASPDGKLGGRLYDAKLSREKQTEICQDFADTIFDAGYQAMIYANKSMLTSEMNPTNLTDADSQIWLAHYTTETNYEASPYIMWQYSSKGSVDGIEGNADVNFLFTRDLAALTPECKKVSASGKEAVCLTWKNIFGVEGYEIEKSTDGNSWSALAKVEGSATISYTDTTARAEEPCYYRVRTYFTRDGKMEYSGFSDSIFYSGKVGTPVLESAESAGYDKIKVTWKPVGGADGYRIYRQNDEGKWVRLAETAKTSYLDAKDIVTGKKYWYRVKAYRIEDGKTVVGEADKAGIKGKAVPATPVWKSAQSLSYNQIKLSWEPVEGADGYRVYRQNDEGKWVRLAETAKTAYVDANDVACGKEYWYRVKAYRTVDGTPVTGEADKAGIKGTAVLSTPVWKSAQSLSYNQIKLSWEPVEGADGYRVYRQNDEGKWVRLKTLSAASYTDAGDVVTGKEYWYRVKAYRVVDGKTLVSEANKAGVKGKAVLATPSVKLKSTKKGTVSISWGKVSGAEGYRVYRKEKSAKDWTRIKNISSGNVVSCTNSAKSKKTYYYTVRALRKVDGKVVLSGYRKDISIKVK